MEHKMLSGWIAIEGIWIAAALLAIVLLTVVGFLIVKSDQDQTARTEDNRARYSACFNRQLDDGFDAPGCRADLFVSITAARPC
jgi:hypothetical protein